MDTEETPKFSARLLARLEDRLATLGELIASRPVGQVLFRQGDRLLWLVEKTAQWSTEKSDTVHSEDEDEDEAEAEAEAEQSPSVVERPLPWVLLLPVLLALRVFRTGAGLLRREPVEAQHVVTFIKNRRRRIRAIKFLGMHNIRSRQRKISNGEHQAAAPIAEKVLVWWPVAFVTSLARLVGLSSTPVYASVESPSSVLVRKRKFEQMFEEQELSEMETSDSVSSDSSDDTTTQTSDDDALNDQQERLSDKLVRMASGSYDSDKDPDYEPRATTPVPQSEDNLAMQPPEEQSTASQEDSQTQSQEQYFTAENEPMPSPTTPVIVVNDVDSEVLSSDTLQLQESIKDGELSDDSKTTTTTTTTTTKMMGKFSSFFPRRKSSVQSN